MFKSSTYGTVMVLDGVIQVTERDEHSYQEMITQVPMFANRNPKKILIIGGGDGGVLREVVKHPGVVEIHMCEIDRQVLSMWNAHSATTSRLLIILMLSLQVVEVCKAFLATSLSTSFDDPRLKLMFADAVKYLREEGSGQNYDVIICDSSDPEGPAECLFTPEFYMSMKAALGPGGVICTLAESQWLFLDFIANLMGECKKFFASVKYCYSSIPSYPSGQAGFLVATVDDTLDPAGGD